MVVHIDVRAVLEHTKQGVGEKDRVPTCASRIL